VWTIVGGLWGSMVAVAIYGFVTGQPLIGVIALIVGAPLAWLWWVKLFRERPP
jgi:hypothetical protein